MHGLMTEDQDSAAILTKIRELLRAEQAKLIAEKKVTDEKL
jgi:hypothetical protein